MLTLCSLVESINIPEDLCLFLQGTRVKKWGKTVNDKELRGNACFLCVAFSPTLKLEAVDSSETLTSSAKIHGVTSQKTVTFKIPFLF